VFDESAFGFNIWFCLLDHKFSCSRLPSIERPKGPDRVLIFARAGVNFLMARILDEFGMCAIQTIGTGE
jgi:hypothetical protein